MHTYTHIYMSTVRLKDFNKNQVIFFQPASHQQLGEE